MNRRYFIFPALFAALLLTTSVYLYSHARDLETKISNYIIATQDAEAESLQHQKKISFLKTDMLVLQSDINKLNATKEELDAQIKQLNRNLYHQKKESKQLLALKENQIEELKQQLSKSDSILKEQQNSNHLAISELSERNKALVLKIEAQEKSIITFKNNQTAELATEEDNNTSFPINDEVNISKLVVELKSSLSNINTLWFTIDTPLGKKLSSKNNSQLKVNIKSAAGDSADVELSYIPDKQDKGIYVFNIYNNNTLMSNAQIRMK